MTFLDFFRIDMTNIFTKKDWCKRIGRGSGHFFQLADITFILLPTTKSSKVRSSWLAFLPTDYYYTGKEAS